LETAKALVSSVTCAHEVVGKDIVVAVTTEDVTNVKKEDNVFRLDISSDVDSSVNNDDDDDDSLEEAVVALGNTEIPAVFL
jgi:hypothetical protein